MTFSKQFSRTDFVILFLAFVLLLSSLLFQPAKMTSRAQYLAPPPQVEHLHFGFRYSLADVLWIRALQDFDYCDSPVGQSACRGQSWLFKMVEAVTELDPQYLLAHTAGALALTILISDIEGASKIYDKAVVRFPDHWHLLLQASYHVIYEEKNPAKAAPLLHKAGVLGAPPWVFSLATKMYSESGQKELGERIYQELQEQGTDPEILKRMRKRLDGEKL